MRGECGSMTMPASHGGCQRQVSSASGFIL
jgi:hypothetical protein